MTARISSMPARSSGLSRNSSMLVSARARALGSQRRIQPATQLHRADVMELGDDRGEIGFDLDPAGTTMGQVRVVEQLQAVGPAATELEQHQGEFAAGIGRARVVPVDHRQPTVRSAADVVGPKVAVTDLHRRHRPDASTPRRPDRHRPRPVGRRTAPFAAAPPPRSPPTPPPRPARCTTRAGVPGWAAPCGAGRPRCGRPIPGRAGGRGPPCQPR